MTTKTVFPYFRYAVGDKVEKYTGDYSAQGEVRAVFCTRAGKARYVVEHTMPGGSGGFLHIYSDANLRLLPDEPEPEKKKSAPLNWMWWLP